MAGRGTRRPCRPQPLASCRRAAASPQATGVEKKKKKKKAKEEKELTEEEKKAQEMARERPLQSLAGSPCSSVPPSHRCRRACRCSSPLRCAPLTTSAASWLLPAAVQAAGISVMGGKTYEQVQAVGESLLTFGGWLWGCCFRQEAPPVEAVTLAPATKRNACCCHMVGPAGVCAGDGEGQGGQGQGDAVGQVGGGRHRFGCTFAFGCVF